MDSGTISELINTGSAGLVIVVVLIFIWYMDRRDKQNTQSMGQIRDSIDKMTSEFQVERAAARVHQESATNDIEIIKSDVKDIRRVVTDTQTRKGTVWN